MCHARNHQFRHFLLLLNLSELDLGCYVSKSQYLALDVVEEEFLLSNLDRFKIRLILAHCNVEHFVVLEDCSASKQFVQT